MAVIVRQKNKDDSLKRFNDFLTVLVIGLGLYLILTPLWPQLAFWIKQQTGQVNNTIPYSASTDENDDKNDTKPVPEDNRLVIPQMDLEGTVHEGQYASTLSKGIWRRPKTSTPDQGGNTVMVAHRFTYSAPAIFYHLDKLRVNDEIAVTWDGELYTYRVREIKIVAPTAVQIENNTPEPILTLYTCTPMWTAEKRLVVISDLIKGPDL